MTITYVRNTLSDASGLPELSFDDLLDESPIKKFRTRSISDDTIDPTNPKRKINQTRIQIATTEPFEESRSEKITSTTTTSATMKATPSTTTTAVSLQNPIGKTVTSSPVVLNNKIALTSSSKQPQKVVKIAAAAGKVLGTSTNSIAGGSVLSQTLGSMSMIGGKTAIKTANGQIVYLQRAPVTNSGNSVAPFRISTVGGNSNNTPVVPKSTIITTKSAASAEAISTAAPSTTNAAGNKTVAIQFVRSADGKLVPLKSSAAGSVKNTLTLSPTVAAQLAGKKIVASTGNQVVIKTAATGAGATIIKSTPLATTSATNISNTAITTLSNSKPIKIQKIMAPSAASAVLPKSTTTTTTTVLNAAAGHAAQSVATTITAKPVALSAVASSSAAGGKVLVQGNPVKQLVVANSQIIKLSPKANAVSGTNAATGAGPGAQLQSIQIPGKPGIQYVRVLPAPKKTTTTVISEASTAAAAKLLNAGFSLNKSEIVRSSPIGGKFYLTSSPKVEGSGGSGVGAGTAIVSSPSKVQKTIVTVPTIRNISSQEKMLTASPVENAPGKSNMPMAITVLRPKSKILEINSEIKRMTAPAIGGTVGGAIGTDVAKKFVSGPDGKRYVVIQQSPSQKLATPTAKVFVKGGNLSTAGTGAGEATESVMKSFVICKNNHIEQTNAAQMKLPSSTTLQQQPKSQVLKAQSTIQQQPTQLQQQQQQLPKQFLLDDKNLTSSSLAAANQSKFLPVKIKEELLESDDISLNDDPFARGGVRRKHCNCSKSQCLKLYCDCFANGEFCKDCTCKDCFNSLQYEDERLRAIRSCLERNPSAFKPKITSAADQGDARLHNKGCNCKRSGCLKNYCECFEAKIPCSNNCKCVGCRNIEDRPDLDMDPIDPKILETIASASNATNTIARAVSNATNAAGKRAAENASDSDTEVKRRRSSHESSATLLAVSQLSNAANVDADDDDDDEDKNNKQSIDKRSTNFITQEVIDATIQCMISQADECLKNSLPPHQIEKMVIEELGRCLVEIIDFSIRNTDNSFTQN